MPATHASKALARFTVLDLTRARSGPTAVRQLADWGANVIKIEAPLGGDADDGLGGARNGPDFLNLHRNKRGMSLNLKSEAGLATFKRIADQVDVIVENFRPDVKTRLGIDYDTLSTSNPKLVYASISGFGQDGPYAKRPGFDQIAQGMGGLMSITGLPGQGPVRVGIPIADLTSGLFLANGILTALLEREVSGRGQWVHTSLLQAQIFMLDFQAARWVIAGEVPGQAGNNHPTSIPTGVFKTADGYINIAASGQTIYGRLCDALGAAELRTDARFATGAARSKHRDALNVEIEQHLAKRTSAAWVEILNVAGVPSGPIYKINDVFADQQVQHLELVDAIPREGDEPLRVVAQPVRLSRTPSKAQRVPPIAGEHNDEILKEFGFKKAEIAKLKKDGAL